MGKKRERKEKMKEGKRQENPNSHPGRDLKGQRQLSAPPSRTPKTSLLSSPHWHLSAAQTHTNAAEGLLQPCPTLTQGPASLLSSAPSCQSPFSSKPGWLHHEGQSQEPPVTQMS